MGEGGLHGALVAVAVAVAVAVVVPVVALEQGAGGHMRGRWGATLKGEVVEVAPRDTPTAEAQVKEAAAALWRAEAGPVPTTHPLLQLVLRMGAGGIGSGIGRGSGRGRGSGSGRGRGRGRGGAVAGLHKVMVGGGGVASQGLVVVVVVAGGRGWGRMTSSSGAGNRPANVCVLG